MDITEREAILASPPFDLSTPDCMQFLETWKVGELDFFQCLRAADRAVIDRSHKVSAGGSRLDMGVCAGMLICAMEIAKGTYRPSASRRPLPEPACVVAVRA